MQPCPDSQPERSEPQSAQADGSLTRAALPKLEAEAVHVTPPIQLPAAGPALSPTLTHLTYSVANGLAEIRLNRPQVLNSVNRKMADELLSVIGRIRADSDVRAVLLAGEGRGFCAGQELSAEAFRDGKLNFDLEALLRETYNPIIRGIREIEKPFVCAVNGVAAGAGATLALACDVVIASKDASFVQSFSRIGLIPDGGGTFFLPRLVGFGRASALAMLGDKLSADEAAQMGMIYKVVEADKLQSESMNLAKRLASQASLSLGLIKRALNESVTNNLEQQLDLEAKLQGIAGASSDFQEGVSAFLQKRKVEFKGQ